MVQSTTLGMTEFRCVNSVGSRIWASAHIMPMTTTGQTSSATDKEATRFWALTPTEYAATVERAAKINARATKRGFTGRLDIVGTEREVTKRDSAGLSITSLVIDTEITGDAPCYNGWMFLAAVDTVETADGAAYVLRAAPGVQPSTLDRSALLPGQCQHCHTIRKNRISCPTPTVSRRAGCSRLLSLVVPWCSMSAQP